MYVCVCVCVCVCAEEGWRQFGKDLISSSYKMGSKHDEAEFTITHRKQ